MEQKLSEDVAKMKPSLDSKSNVHDLMEARKGQVKKSRGALIAFATHKLPLYQSAAAILVLFFLFQFTFHNEVIVLKEVPGESRVEVVRDTVIVEKVKESIKEVEKVRYIEVEVPCKHPSGLAQIDLVEENSMAQPQLSLSEVQQRILTDKEKLGSGISDNPELSTFLGR